MDRRNFLRAMIAAGMGATLDLDKLLWTPGQMVTVPAMPIMWHGCLWTTDEILGKNMVISFSPEFWKEQEVAFFRQQK